MFNVDTLLLWGLYVEYIEEAFKFIKRKQLIVIKLEEYKKRKTAHILKVRRLHL